MCGITGVVSKNPELTAQQRIQKATDALSHRGPEQEGFYTNQQNTVILGHRRLSIIDGSTAAAQPMKYRSRYHLVFNGELYNYRELKSTLQQKGFEFKSSADSEVVVAAYAAFGRNCLQQFEGAFAFAIWDEVEHQLFAARDRFGEKPFFFFYDEEQLAFASEMKALWSMGIAKEVNRSMLYNFLTIDYTSNPGNPQETFFKNIYHLPAAHFLLYSAKKHVLEITQYWHVDIEINYTISEAAAIEQFTDLFSDAISKQLRSDVPVGTSLSGGLDSSTILSFCQQQTNDQYTHKAFTVTFKGFEKDESRFAALVANHFHVQHYVADIPGSEITSLMHTVMKHQEAPFISASVLAQFKVYELAKKNGVTVVLDGQGADEILAGYHKYYQWYWLELWRNKQLKKSNELEATRLLGIDASFDFKKKIGALLPDFAASLHQSKKAKDAFKQRGLDREFAFSNKRNLYYSTPSHFTLNSALYFNTFVHGLQDLLRMADRNSMANALEVRLPFLHHKLVEFLFALPPHFKIHDGWTKWLLRKSVEKRLPAAVVWRRDKVGFEPPQKKWMQQDAVIDAIRQAKEVLVDNKVLDPSALNKKIQPHASHVAENKEWKYWSASFLFS